MINHIVLVIKTELTCRSITETKPCLEAILRWMAPPCTFTPPSFSTGILIDFPHDTGAPFTSQERRPLPTSTAICSRLQERKQGILYFFKNR